jgi:hypothetical protein
MKTTLEEQAEEFIKEYPSYVIKNQFDLEDPVIYKLLSDFAERYVNAKLQEAADPYLNKAQGYKEAAECDLDIANKKWYKVKESDNNKIAKSILSLQIKQQ